jgi:hypothetical protein
MPVLKITEAGLGRLRHLLSGYQVSEIGNIRFRGNEGGLRLRLNPPMCRHFLREIGVYSREVAPL